MNSRCRVCDTENAVSNASDAVCSFCAAPLTLQSSPAGALPLGTRLEGGAFSVGPVIGLGGFGITYAGVDLKLHRRVAVKEFFPYGSYRTGTRVCNGADMSAAVFEAARERFLHEARVMARFQHPGIVHIFGFFQANDTGYIVMELLLGKTLSAAVADGPLPEETAIDYVTQVARALRVVHEAGFVHRDLKPDNIFLTDEGRVVLLDFGTAKELLAGSKPVTAMVSPGYAPPEQYHASYAPDARSDVYALAATLYHLLTGQAPMEAPARSADNDLPLTRVLNPYISPHVSDAIAEAMALDAARRPPTADAFVSLLRSVPPAAAVATAAIPVKELLARTAARTTPAAAAPAPTTAAAAAPPVAAASAPTEPAPPSSATQAAPATPEFSSVVSPDLGAMVPSTAGAGGVAPPSASPPAVAGPAPGPLPPPLLHEVERMRGHNSMVRSVDFTPSGEWLFSGSEDKSVRIWGVRSRESHGRLGLHEGWVTCVRVSPDGQRLATASYDRSIRLWDVETQRLLSTLHGSGSALSVAFAPNGQSLAASFIDGVVIMWDLNGRERARTPSIRQSIWGVAFSPEGSQLAFGSWLDPYVQLWDVPNWREAGRMKVPGSGVRSVNWSPDGRFIATTSKDPVIRLWDVASRTEALHLEGHRGGVSAVAFHPYGPWIASAGTDKSIRIWDLASRQCIQVLETHTGEVMAVTFSRDGRWLASGSQDERVGLFSTAG